MSKIYVGTSRWSYEWNEENSLEWYKTESGLNAIELNMSYYRFPYPNMVKSWAKKALDLAWVIKVNRLITHLKKLNSESYEIFKRFTNLFKPLDKSICYFLLQFPSSFTDLDKIEKFLKNCGNEKIAIEFRNPIMFSKKIKKWAKDQNILLVSVDAPHLPIDIMSDKKIYLRIHGKDIWYSYDYKKNELEELINRIPKNFEEIFIFFNNNHNMLNNAKSMFRLLYKK